MLAQALAPTVQTFAGLAANLEPQRPHVGSEWFGFSTWAISHPTIASLFLLSGEGGHATDPRPGEHRQINSRCREDPDSTGESKAEGPLSSTQKGLSGAGTGQVGGNASSSGLRQTSVIR